MNIREWVIFELIFFRKIPRSETAGWYAVQLAVFLRTSILFYRRRQWQPTPVLLPGESHGWRSLVGCSPWDREESDMTERLPFHFSLSCIGEGNGNPLQSSCLENPRDGGAWWAVVCGISQSRTRLKRLSSQIRSDQISRSVVSDSLRPLRRQPIRLHRPWDSPGRTLEWVAISFSKAWKWKVKAKSFSRVWLFATPWTAAYH